MSKKTDNFINQYGIDFRYEIRIGLWWREQIGDDAYLTFDADDMVRWYLALERLGAVEVRAMLNERMGSRPMSHLRTLSRAPHPPIWLVERWLETHETRVHTLPYWGGAIAAVFLMGMVGSWLAYVANLVPMNNNLIMHPPQGLTPPPPSSVVSAPSYNVAPLLQPVVPGPTTPQNIGIGSGGSAGIAAASSSSSSSASGH